MECPRLIKKPYEPTLLDKALGYLNPQWGLERIRHGTTLASYNSWVGASKRRKSMQEWKTSGGDADADTLFDLPTLRERSRDLCRNNPLALGAVNTNVTNVVGSGLKLHSRIYRDMLPINDAQADRFEQVVEREWALWANSTDCDATRTNTFAELQQLVFRSVLENGDAFAILPYRKLPNQPYGTCVQVIEADRISNTDHQMDSDKLAGGVERDSLGAPTAYHIATRHPGVAYGFTTEWKRYPAYGQDGRRQVLHLFRRLRPAQTRGVPYLSPVIELLKQLGTFTDSELMAAVVGSMFTVFVTTENGQGFTPPAEKQNELKLGSGAVLDLFPGEKVEFADPKRPNQAFDPFVLSILRQIGVALELPFEILVKHFTASYSAARAAMLEAWKYFVQRREWLATNFCQPVFEAWLEEAILLGRIAAPGFVKDAGVRAAYCHAQWIGPAKGNIDELREAKASELMVNAGFSTLAEETSHLTGGDWYQNHQQRVKEVTLRREAGLEVDPTKEPLDLTAN
jgi:lambda family phage portal protein